MGIPQDTRFVKAQLNQLQLMTNVKNTMVNMLPPSHPKCVMQDMKIECMEKFLGFNK